MLERAQFLFFGILLSFFSGHLSAQTSSNIVPSRIRIVELQGQVEVSLSGATTWTVCATNQSLKSFDRIRTGPNSRVALLWSDESIIPFGAQTELEILPPPDGSSQSGLHLVRGLLSFFHRDKPGRIRVITRGAAAGIEGTEFVLAVNDTDRTTLSVVDGRVRFGNDKATLILTNGQQAMAEVGQAPMRTAGFQTENLLQWCFYYPAVLDLADLSFTTEEQTALADSLTAYRSGDLLPALARYPKERKPGSNSERLYYAALLLSVGQVEQTETTLAALNTEEERTQKLATALRQLIAAVKRNGNSSPLDHQLPTALLAASYYEQSKGVRGNSLENALSLAREATLKSPEFGFAWTRLAELEFSFGHTRKAMDALETGLKLSPRHAQALALKGFLLAAENKTTAAVAWFNRALEIDSALGNAWLGRGLCRIRCGDNAGGREDLLVAAALEPQRAELRNYLGKAYENVGDFSHATRELDLAKKLDPNDPTPWLYSALINQENNRVNDAIRDLEKSEQLNDNRSVYRSQLLLDEDHAVRSANLARIYADAGMTDVSLREASRAVGYDYANYSAHLFLAESYEALRGHNGGYNLRYETPTGTEYLLANLLAPVNAGPLSPAISQNEYSPLFNQNHVGLLSDTEYLSRGAWAQSFAQYGTFDTFNYTVEGLYRTDPGQRINNDLELQQISLSLKQQFTPQDTVYFQVGVGKTEAGDLSQVYDPTGSSVVRTKETHEPDLALGYHHEWSPGAHTLVLLGRQVDVYSVNNPNSARFSTASFEGQLVGIFNPSMSERLRVSQELYSAEIQQIFQQEAHTTVFGALFQHTDFNHRYFATTVDPIFSEAPNFPNIASQNINTDFERVSLYGYHSWQVLDVLLLQAGLSYDQIHFPAFMFSPPYGQRQQTREQISPKVGLIWTPATNTTVRAAYTRSLTGASLDQSFRLEPTQVGGLNQSYRSLVSESLTGASAGAAFDTYGLSLEQKFKSGTYFALRGELLYSHVDRMRGSYFYDGTLDFPYGAITNFGLNERLNYRERSVVASIDQLVSSEWGVGMNYRLTQAELNDAFLDSFAAAASAAVQVKLKQHFESLLHQVNLHANFNHTSGFFACAEAVWYLQSNSGFTPDQPGDDFWQFNLLGGYRFWHRRARIEAGILNLSDQDYRLNPLVWHNDLPRGRTFVTRLQLAF